MDRKTQEEMIVDYIRENGSITPQEAMNALGIMRLSARIYDLRHHGYEVKTVSATEKNRYGVPCTFARYSLEE